MKKKQKSLLPKTGIRYTEWEGVSRERKKNSLLEEKYSKLEKTYQYVLDTLNKSQGAEKKERLLKNEAYAFLIAEGLLDKFLEFRGSFNRTKAQDVIFLLVRESDPEGLWIEV